MTNAELQACESIKGIHREMKKANEPNWEQRRYEIAKDVLAGIVGNPNVRNPVDESLIVKCAVGFAELLINELKGGIDDTKDNY